MKLSLIILSFSSVGRLVVTKRAGFDDDFGNRDMEDISLLYKSREGIVHVNLLFDAF